MYCLKKKKTRSNLFPQASAGRPASSLRHGPRPLDLDIIFYGAASGEVAGDGRPLPVQPGSTDGGEAAAS